MYYKSISNVKMYVLFSSRSAFLSKNFSRRFFLVSKANIHTGHATLLYSQASLGLDKYSNTRERMTAQFKSLRDNFLRKMEEFVQDDPKNMIFTEDLKNMVYIAEKKDINLTVKMIKKFNSQISEYRFGSFIFGPVVMRMFHYLNLPNEALECFNESLETDFFDQHISYQLLLDLLFCHQRYNDMYKVFEVVKQKQINMTKYPRYTVVLIMGACYKQNTPESLEYASKLFTDMNDTGSVPLRRACTFLAGLALRQGAPHVALEVLSNQSQHYVTIRNIKAQALAAMGRVEDALPVLRAVLDIDVPSQKDKHTFFAETIEKVEHAVEQSASKEVRREFDRTVSALRERNLIDTQNLERHLTGEIQVTRRPQDQEQVKLHASYQGLRRAAPAANRTRRDTF